MKSKLYLLPIVLTLILGGCTTSPAMSSTSTASRSTITLWPLQLEGSAPFCVYSPELHFDSQKIVLGKHDQIRACTSSTPSPRRDPNAPLYWTPALSRDFPFWDYKALTVTFQKSEQGPQVRYTVHLEGKFNPKPDFRLAGLFLVITPDSVQVRRWDIKRKPGQPVEEGIQEVSLVAEVKEMN